MNVDVDVVPKVQTKISYFFGTKSIKEKEFIVAGKSYGVGSEERVKGLWIPKENFGKLAPALVALVKEYAPEALKQ